MKVIMKIEKRIMELGIELPEPAKPLAMFVPVRQTGNTLFVSGQIPVKDGILIFKGKVGNERTLEEAQAAARLCVVNLLSALKGHLGDLDRVTGIIKIQAFVNSETGFMEQHIVANAASQLLYDVFDEAGRHARTAVGTNQLPLDATVEIEAIVEVEIEE